VLEDRYPVLLVNGRRLAEDVRTAIIERGDDIASLLTEIAVRQGSIVDISDPDQVLFHL
jgi:hypothetical protein